MKARSAAICATLATLAVPLEAGATEKPGTLVTLPSGAEMRWLETLQDNAGGSGLTYRFRFLMSDLAARVPSTTGPAGEPEDDPAPDRAPIEIDTESDEVAGADSAEGDYLDDGMIDPETLDLSPVEADDAAEEAADSMVDEPALPAAPDVLAQDPLHEDLVWLCDKWVLPRIASPGPRPRMIIISVADKDIPFGSYDPDVLQLFEAFRLPAEGDACEWEPW